MDYRPALTFTLKTSTWVSNSHGLYDYESHTVSAKTYKCNGRSSAYRVLRKGVDVSLVTDGLGRQILVRDEAVQTIAKLTALEEGAYSLEPVSPTEDLDLRQAYSKSRNEPPPKIPTQSELEQARDDLAFWVVMRSLPEGSVPLKDGDKIKLGRLAFKIRQIVVTQSEDRKVEDDDLATCETRRSDCAAMAVVAPPSSHVEMSHSMPPRTLSAISSSSESSWPAAKDESSVNDTADQVSSATSSSAPVREAAAPPETGPPLCRVCLCEEEDGAKNPLISPCKCAGSMQWIHLDCLRTWMEGRLNSKADDAHGGAGVYFFWRPLECELCQEPYPTYVDLGGGKPANKDLADPVERALRNTNQDDRIIELFQIPKPAVPFIVLESRHHPSGESGFHFVSFQNKNVVQLGRGHEADIRVADISVSRLHAAIRFEPNALQLPLILRECDIPLPPDQRPYSLVPYERSLRTPLGHLTPLVDIKRPYVYVQDLKSKFGTLIGVSKPIILFPRMLISVQVGRTVLTIHVRKPSWSRLIPSCLHYRGFLVPRKRRRRRSSETAASGLGGLAETHDIRLIETYVPMSLLSDNPRGDLQL